MRSNRRDAQIPAWSQGEGRCGHCLEDAFLTRSTGTRVRPATEATKATRTVASVLGQVDDEKDERCDDGEDRCEEQALA